MNLYRTTVTALLTIISTLSYANETLVFATEATYNPIVYTDNNGQINGFETELVQAVCDQLTDVNCQFVHNPWDTLIPQLKLGKFDALYGGMEITAERQKQVAFTDHLYDPSAAFVFASEQPIDIEKIAKNTTVGVQIGTTFGRYLAQNYGKNLNIKNYTSLQDALIDLKNNRVDAVLGDTLVVNAWLQANQQTTQGYQLAVLPDQDNNHFSEGMAIAIKPNNPKLLNQLNEAIQHVKEQGIAQTLYKKYIS